MSERLMRNRLVPLETLLSRRTVLRGALGAGLAGLLAACGEDDDDDSAPTATSRSEGEQDGATPAEDGGQQGDAETRTVEHALGSAEIPTSPERVIALDPYITLPTALAVDAPVIATCYLPFGDPFPAFVDSTLTDGIENIGWFTEMDLEKVVELQPDLIVGRTSFVEDAYDQLAEIAPTVAIVTADEDGQRRNWKAVVRDVADVLGAEAAIEESISAHEARIRELQDLLGDRLDDLEVSLTNFRAQDDIRIYTADSCAGQTLEEIGFGRPEGHGPVEDGINIGLSIERLNEIDADLLFYFVGSAATEPEEAQTQSDAIKANPLWEQLEAVQNGQTYEINQRWWFSCGSVQAADRIVDDLVEMLVDEAGMGSQVEEPVPTASESDAGEWTFTDDRGIEINLPQRPDQVVAQTTSAAALWDYGVRPAGIFGPARLEDGSPDFQAGNIDLDAVEYLGDFGEMDLEMLVALQADIYVDLTYGGGQLWYLGDNEERVAEIVPTLGISMEGVSILDSIERFEDLAGMLGADLTADDVVEAKSAFEDAEAELKAAIEERPGLTVLVVAPTVDQVYIASPAWMTDLYYFRELGLDVVDHGMDDFWDVLSWEQANKYQADLILVDARSSQLEQEQLMEIETWASLPAVQAGQVGPWYAGAPYSHKRFAPIMQELAALIRESRDEVV